MRVQISATSNWDFDKTTIIEVNSIDEAINRLRTDKELVMQVIDEDCSWITTEYCNNSFIVHIPEFSPKDYDLEIEIYDQLRE